MNKTSNTNFSLITRVLIIAASLALSLPFFFPLWNIGLSAPQYPEGLSMQIWLTKITGDLQNINVLNHYIGMHAIKPNEIPELRYFVWIFAGLVAFGLLTALLGKRLILIFWVALLLLFSTGALVDFYQWEYRYGHELSDDAPIKMEGQYYQPPLLGKKVIMNIEAFSMPAIGGLGHIAAIFLAIAALFTEWRRRKGIQIDMKSLTLCFLLSTSASLLGCSSSGPKSIDYGGDHCDECRMVISDKRFGGELVTEKGKAFKFDSLECLLRFNDQHAGEKMTAYVVNSSLPNQFVKAQEAAFLYDKKLRSPMGKGILSGPNPTSLQQFIRPNDPASEQESIATWPAVVDLLSTNEVTATSK